MVLGSLLVLSFLDSAVSYPGILHIQDELPRADRNDGGTVIANNLEAYSGHRELVDS